jgi:hypothetical protein
MWAVKRVLHKLATVALLVPCSSLAQSPDSVVRSVCVDGRVVEAFNPNGWTVPGISKTDTKTTSKWSGATLEPLPKSAEVRIDVLESKAPEGSFAFISCVDDKPGQVTIRKRDDVLESKAPEGSPGVVDDKPSQVTIREQEVDVTDDIWRFEMNGSVFAFRVIGRWASGSGSQRVHLGTATTLLFYDSDGCGQFKVMRYADGDWPFMLIVPDWVRLPKPTCTPRNFH